MSFLYERLGEHDIRLLTISVHDGRTALLELHTYSKTSAPQYDALSYTWGEDTSVTLAMCNGVPLEIRTGLFKALPFVYALRSASGRPLWIDAICLNQGDHIEKATHVPLMGAIYEMAARTLICLGESADNSDLAMDNIYSLTQAMLAVDSSLSLTLHETLAEYGLPAVDDQKWKALKTLHLRP